MPFRSGHSIPALCGTHPQFLQVNAGHSSRKTPLPVESTGLESRRERRARAERHAATNETIAALEVRIRQRWLEQHRDPPQLQPGASPMLVDDEQVASSASKGLISPASIQLFCNVREVLFPVLPAGFGTSGEIRAHGASGVCPPRHSMNSLATRHPAKPDFCCLA